VIAWDADENSAWVFAGIGTLIIFISRLISVIFLLMQIYNSKLPTLMQDFKDKDVYKVNTERASKHEERMKR
jgi:hypothetical protein